MYLHLTSLNKQLDAVLNKGGEASALISDGDVISYAQLKSRVAATAARLQDLSISKGAHVAFQLPSPRLMEELGRNSIN